MKWLLFFLSGVFLTGLLSCTHKKVVEDRGVDYRWVRVDPPAQLQDDMHYANLAQVLQAHINYWQHPARQTKVIRFGEEFQVSAKVYTQSLSTLLEKIRVSTNAKKSKESIKFRKGEKRKEVPIDNSSAGLRIKNNRSPQPSTRLSDWIQEKFVFLAIENEAESTGEIFMTSYYEPVISARSHRDDLYRQAIYGVPKDMVLIQMQEFAETFPHWSWWADQITEQKSNSAVVRARLREAREEEGLPEVVPYFSRKQIDVEGQLEDRDLVLAWVKPIDSFFLQIQGSGVLRFENGKTLRVGYAAQNGHPYVPIGKFMFDAIPREEMSLQAIETFMSRLPFSDQQAFMNRNPSYVFFRELPGRGETYMGTEVVDGRTIATDYRIFPKGTLAYLEFQKPILSDENSYQPASRFVMDQDTGGAIRGPHRVDLFWGMGEEAKEYAGRIRHEGRIFYLFPKSALQ